jgi:DnaK suppressor protein
MFNADQLAEFRKRLLQKQQELLELTGTSEDASRIVELDQCAVGRLSRMDELQGQAMSIERQRRRRIELNDIEAALRRIDAGSFGYCTRCEEEIAVKRLEYDPATPLCIACASKDDAG